MWGQAGLPYYARRLSRDAMRRRPLLDRIVFEFSADLGGVGRRFPERVARSDREKTKVDSARESPGPNRGHWSGFAMRLVKKSGRE